MPSPGYVHYSPTRKAENTSPTLEAIQALQKMKSEKARGIEYALHDLATRKKQEHREREADPHRNHDYFNYSVELTVAESAEEAAKILSPPQPLATEYDGLPPSLEP